VLDILEDLENKKAGKKASEDKESGKSEVDRKATVSDGKRRGSRRYCRGLFVDPGGHRLDSSSNRERNGNGRKRLRSPRRLDGKRSVRSPSS
jgi:hypothetical protein